MSVENILGQLTGLENKVPPVELWNPPYCGEMDIVIKADGSWFYNGTVFKRLSLVRLLSSVLKKENDEYFLVTPVEKIKISVEDAPYVLTQWQWQNELKQSMIVATHLNDEFILNSEHKMRCDDSGQLYVTVRRNLEAKVHRNVFYQWVDLASEVPTESGTSLVFTSANQEFALGTL